MTSSSGVPVPAFLRGEIVTDNLVSFDGRDGETAFRAPAPSGIVERLPLRDAAALADAHALEFDDIVAYLDELGGHLELERNALLQEALDHAERWSDLTRPLVRASFKQLPSLFRAANVREMAEIAIGADYLDGWAERRLADGRVAAVRAMGARAVHIIAGNSPLISALTVIRNAITRSDAIVKAPSNDPLTAVAIARTMHAVAPDHPITRHLSVAYWKGGDTAIEERLYQPRNIDKIIAWGGLASVSHVVRYVQPGLELVTLDPKRSATIIGPQAFADERTLRDVARHAATDVGALNQVGCVNARVIYVIADVADANRLGELMYRALLELPEDVSTEPRRFDPELRARLQALRTSPDFYRVFGGGGDEGAVVVSQLDDPVDFHRSLSGRVANVVPVGGIEQILPHIDTWTQTIGIYPDSLRRSLRDVLGWRGAQRLVSLGYATRPSMALPQDGMEPVRRMLRWIVDEDFQCEQGEPLCR